MRDFGQRELVTNTTWSSVHNPLGINVKVENGGSLNIFSVELLLCHTAANGSLDLNRKISTACQMDSVKRDQRQTLCRFRNVDGIWGFLGGSRDFVGELIAAKRKRSNKTADCTKQTLEKAIKFDNAYGLINIPYHPPISGNVHWSKTSGLYPRKSRNVLPGHGLDLSSIWKLGLLNTLTCYYLRCQTSTGLGNTLLNSINVTADWYINKLTLTFFDSYDPLNNI